MASLVGYGQYHCKSFTIFLQFTINTTHLNLVFLWNLLHWMHMYIWCRFSFCYCSFSLSLFQPLKHVWLNHTILQVHSRQTVQKMITILLVHVPVLVYVHSEIPAICRKRLRPGLNRCCLVAGQNVWNSVINNWQLTDC